MSPRTRGFTIIELLVVIAIIGILSVTVMVALSESRIKARDARRIEDIREIQKALELYVNDNQGEYPDDIYSASDGLANSASGASYIPVMPKDPRGTNYLYANLTRGSTACAKASGLCTTYVLGAVMEGVVPPDVNGAMVGSGSDYVVCTNGTPGSTPNNYCVRQ